ncbi:Endoribonuclease LACTB2 [Hypsizygus marmoreus]|uniref:Endoribonuclease LACTB2 n=1 Tax=Hypsizygus marmoreus TaxID=39966 RepID=A0A369JS69_HYPMA|nr:Endoribonuclease LACTB2 [Hypsizygus marmoreus]
MSTRIAPLITTKNAPKQFRTTSILTPRYQTFGNSIMDQLEVLPSVSRLSDHVVRVLGQNPGKFTLQGTNTYIVGKSNPYTLIDTGEGRDEYIPILESALLDAAQPTNPTAPDISDIVISHWHPDHVNGLPSVLTLLQRLWSARNPTLPFPPPRLHKFPTDFSTPLTAHAHAHDTHHILRTVIAALPPTTYAPSPTGAPFYDLHDSEVLSPSGLRVLHTPGHTDDSICLYIPQDRVLYTADTVLGQGTAVFEDLAAYIASLTTMLHFGDGDASHEYTALYPGHGPVVTKGKELISSYIRHRLEREEQILNVLHTPPPSGDADAASEEEPQRSWTTWSIVTTMYAAYPESLWLPAAHSVDLHLKKLQADGVARKVSGELQHTVWELVDILSVSAPPVDRKHGL